MLHPTADAERLVSSTGAAGDVVTVRWPADTELLAALRDARRPRLLLVDGSAPAPAVDDCLEDWIRIPAPSADIEARLDALRRTTIRHLEQAAATSIDELGPPTLDDDGLLRFRGSWVSIPPVEARLLRALLDRMGAVVARDAVTAAGWPSEAPGRNALDVHVLRLRRRLAPLGLAIRTIRSRGYLLEVDERLADRGDPQDRVRNESQTRA